jgi:hypothetical protein
MRAKIDRSPVSLKAGGTAAARKVLADVKATNGSPSGVPGSVETDAIANPGLWNLWVVFDLPDASTTVDVKVWWWSETAQKWVMDSRVGTSGVTQFADTDEDPSIFIEGPAARWMYIELDAMSGTMTTGVSAWVDGLEPQQAA